MLLKKHMWNIISSGYYTLLSALWPIEGLVWEEVLWETSPVSFFFYHMSPEPCHSISACSTAVTVCIFDILTDAKREQVLRISATILFNPRLRKSWLRSTELSECIIVIYISVWLLDRALLQSFCEKKGRESEREHELMWFRWTKPCRTPTTDQEHGNVFEHRPFSFPLSLLGEFCWSVLSL